MSDGARGCSPSPRAQPRRERPRAHATPCTGSIAGSRHGDVMRCCRNAMRHRSCASFATGTRARPIASRSACLSRRRRRRLRFVNNRKEVIRCLIASIGQSRSRPGSPRTDHSAGHQGFAGRNRPRDGKAPTGNRRSLLRFSRLAPRILRCLSRVQCGLLAGRGAAFGNAPSLPYRPSRGNEDRSRA